MVEKEKEDWPYLIKELGIRKGTRWPPFIQQILMSYYVRQALF